MAAAVSTPTVPATIRPRSPAFDFSSVPRHWLAGNLFATHVANGLNLLFPAGERFFVRSVRKYLDRIDDPKLREDIRGFSGQEGLHAYAHERYFEALERQGFDVRTFLGLYEKIAFGVAENVFPPQMRLSVTAACEHFTATMATHALQRYADGNMMLGDPTMRALFLWHAVEEIEHRSVAFDVLRAVNPSYALRVSGFALASSLLFGLWTTAALTLIVQEKAPPRKVLKAIRARRRARKENGIAPTDYGQAVREYLRRDFHPSQDTRGDGLARQYASEAGL
jgi:predicted metal-dependent hydrolase